MPGLVDFHVHLPVQGLAPQFTAYHRRYTEECGPERAGLIRRWSDDCEWEWREAWGFPEPEPDPPLPEAAARWSAEAERNDLRKVVFISGGGNARRLLEAVADG